MRRIAWLCASILSCGALHALRAQSSHLSDLERAAPATTGDAVASGAAAGWGALWTVPAAAPSLRGVLVGLEGNDFGSVTTVLASARLHVGILWQLQFAETHVTNVIDPELLAQYPELGTLRAMARFVAVDGARTVGRATLSAGLRQEYDELLGVQGNGLTGRGAIRVRLFGRTALASVVDRALTAGLGTPAGARAQIALSQDAATKAGRLEINAGARVGRLRESEMSETALALGAALSVRDILSVNASAGSVQLAQGPWTWRAAFGVGIDLGSLGTHFRYTFRPEGRGASRAVAITYTRRDPTPAAPRDPVISRR
jgi:hypothetical protein